MVIDIETLKSVILRMKFLESVTRDIWKINRVNFDKSFL